MKRKLSFTMVEILTAVAIIGILSGIALGVNSFVQSRKREVQTQATLKIIEMALEQYKTKYGSYPVIHQPGSTISNPFFHVKKDDKTLGALFVDSVYKNDMIQSIKGIQTLEKGDYLRFLDGYGSPVIYVYPGVFNKTKYDLGSMGENKLLGDAAGTGCEPAAETWNLGARNNSSGTYRANFGKEDDITNFKRTDD